MRRALFLLLSGALACHDDPATGIATSATASSPALLVPLPEFGWTATVLPTPANAQSGAEAIASDGRVAGWIDVGSSRQAVKWENGALVVLPAVPTAFESRALDINATGVTVGYASLPNVGDQPVRWTSAGPQLLFSGGLRGRAESINEQGVAVGWVISGDNYYPMRWDASGSYTGMSIPSGYGDGARATGINDLGDVVGTAYTEAAQANAYRWNASGTSSVIMGLNLGVQTWASDIANSRLSSGGASGGNTTFSVLFGTAGAGTIVGPTGSRGGRLSDKGRMVLLNTGSPQTLKGSSVTTLPIPLPYVSAVAAGVNACGTTVRTANGLGATGRAVRWSRVVCD